MNVKEFVTTLLIGVFKNGLSIGWTIMVSMYPSIAKVLAPFNNEMVSQVAATFIGVVVVSLGGTLYRRMKHNAAIAEAFAEGAGAMERAIVGDKNTVASCGDHKSVLPTLLEILPEIKQPGQDGFISLQVVLLASLIVSCALLLASCRTVTVNEVPGGGPVYVNQSYAPDITLSALTGLDTNAWRAIAQGAAAGATK